MELSFEKICNIAKLSNTCNTIFQISNGELHMLYFSENLAALFGYTTEEFAKLKKKNGFLFDFENPDQIEQLKKDIQEVIQKDILLNISVSMKHKSGEYISVIGQVTYMGEFNSYPTLLAVVDDKSDKLRKENLQLVIQNEQRYKNVINFADILVWDYNIETKTIFNDNDFFDKFGISQNMTTMPEGFLRQGFVDNSSLEEFVSAFDRLAKGAKEASQEVWFHFSKLSSPICLRVKYKVDNNNSNIAHAIGINITEQKNAETTFAQRTSSILKMNPDAIATFQMNITTNTVTSASCNEINLHPLTRIKVVDDLLARYLDSIVDKLEKINFINTFSRGNLIAAFNSGKYTIECKHHLLIGKNKENDNVNTMVNLIKNPITAQIEGVLHVVNVHERTLLDNLTKGIVYRDFNFIALCGLSSKRGIIIDKNIIPNGTAMLHNFDESFRNELSQTIEIPEERKRVINFFSIDNIKSELSNKDEYTIIFNTNSDHNINKHIQITISYGDNKKKTLLIACQNTTEMYNAELKQKQVLTDALMEARKANRAKSDFLSLVSHDIRTPLNGIMGMTGLALEEELSPKAREYLEKAQTSSVFLLGLINDLLDMGKIEAGKMELNPDIYTVEDFNHYVNAVILPLCQKKNINFTVKSDTSISGAIVVDSLRFNQILFNILSNAVKYTHENGNVSLLYSQEKISENMAHGIIQIEDDGIGMSKEFQEKLFDTFTQENRDKKYINLGSGLGLSIVKSLIDLMGGSISVKSEINKGTCITVELDYPYIDNIEESHQKRNKRKKDYSKLLSGKHVLLCEDNEINIEIAHELLKNVGLNVDLCWNGLEGYEKFVASGEDYYDAILMDIRMPKMNGLEATTNIRNCNIKYGKYVPIIAMTANAMSEDRENCLNAGMNDFISKPINKEDLYKSLYNLISNNRK